MFLGGSEVQTFREVNPLDPIYSAEPFTPLSDLTPLLTNQRPAAPGRPGPLAFGVSATCYQIHIHARSPLDVVLLNEELSPRS